MKSENEKSKLKSKPILLILKETFVDFCSNSTAHALPSVFRSENVIVKIIWMILFFVGVGGCIYYVYDSLHKFFQYEVAVDVKWNEMALQTFPAVTFCNINPFDSSNLGVKAYLELMLTSNGLSTNLTASEDEPAIFQVNQALKVLKASALTEHNTKSDGAFYLGFYLDSMLISCFYGGVKCSSSDFKRSYSFEYGSCYTFNSKGDKKTSKTGISNGLTMEIFTGFPSRQDYFIENQGIYLAVHNNSQNPIPKYEGIRLPVGFSSNVAVKRTFNYRKEAPYSNCRISSAGLATDSDYVNKTIKLTQYSRKLCFEICIQNLHIIPGCGCSDPSVPITDKSQTICSTLDKLKCVDSIRAKFDSSDLSLNCSQLCPNECDRIIYETSVSSSNYPTYYYYNIVSKQSNVENKFNSFSNVTYNLFKESVLMVNVFYDELGYTTIIESSLYTSEGIFATIGGQLGFILGISLLSVCEIIMFFIDLLIRIIEYFIKRKKNGIESFK
ncbi:unnamed protein product [Brachionus calyciflorus]|uniref:Uncharacterized protein n=1 Tax=Brachionus calyciflorus TaxID=104777 RepID=A0A813ZIT9_9BILA|nr:unnamed protein product [Brachionus calyciflorus]